MPCSKGWLFRSYVKKDRNQVKQEHDVLYEGQYERIPAEVLQRIKSLEWNDKQDYVNFIHALLMLRGKLIDRQEKGKVCLFK